MGSIASVHTLRKQAMRLHNVNNLLNSVAVELVNVVLKQLLWCQVGWWPPVWLLKLGHVYACHTCHVLHTSLKVFTPDLGRHQSSTVPDGT
eukprot:4226230-Prymnesium_polylepis.1